MVKQSRILWVFSAIFSLLTGQFPTSAQGDEIPIAIAVPLTGMSAGFGDIVLRGAKTAIADINEQGGVLGKKLKLVISDDRSDPRDAVSVANQLATQKITLLIGHFDSSSALPTSSIYNEEGIVAMSPGATNPQYTEQGYKNIFRLCGRDDAQGALAASYIAKHFQGKKVAILDNRTAYGHGIAQIVKNALNQSGISESLYEIIGNGEKDYSAVVLRLQAKKIDVIFHGGHYQEAGVILRQLREHGVKSLLIGADSLAVNDFWALAGKAAEGTIFTFEPNYSHTQERQKFIKHHKANLQPPEAYYLNTYAAVQIYADAIAKTGSVKGNIIADYLHSHSFDTVLGKVTFDAKGDWINHKYVFYRYSNGVATEIGSD